MNTVIPVTIEELEKVMSECEQTRGQSVLQHGINVCDYFDDLISGRNKEWALPEDIETQIDHMLLRSHDISTIKRYLRYHDCGKPFCRTVDDEGRVHFPDHANVSKELWLSIFPEDQVVANLIGWDMSLHSEKSVEIAERLKNEWTEKDAMTLCLASLSEVHSNAAMFGGTESTSFKSKFKKIRQRVRQILDHFS